MSKRMKVLTLVLAVILLVTAGTATIAMAQEDKPTLVEGVGVKDSLLARVAEILDIPQEELVYTLQQVLQELREECPPTGNSTIRQEMKNGFTERHMYKRQEMGQGSQGNGIENQQNTRLRVSQSVRGRQMIAAPRG